jgi:dipeptidyl-peptidase-4
MVRPPGFDAARRYPVAVHVYGGPHAQRVRRVWPGEDSFEQVLALNGFIVWSLDNRGSWGHGHAFEAHVDRRLGTVELADQLAGVNWLKAQPGVDGDRIGITGWSYGGFMTLVALTQSPDVWRCGLAGAPVTDYRLYDSVYTERYMGTPDQNPNGYRDGAPLEHTDRLAAPLLLVHGADDDNVHLQHTLQFVDALSRHGKPYELIVQPGEKHGFRSLHARRYFRERALDFFQRHLGEPS